MSTVTKPTVIRAPRKCSQCRQEGCNKGKATCPINVAKTVIPVEVPIPVPVEVTNWRIYEIEYKYPSIAPDDKKGLSLADRGIMNIENIYIENENDLAVLSFENNVEITLGKKENARPKWDENSIVVNNNIKQQFIEACLNTDISNIKFDGTENDEDGNYTTKQNIKNLKNGEFGKYIKIAISGNNYGENLNAENKAKVLQEINKFINTDNALSK